MPVVVVVVVMPLFALCVLLRWNANGEISFFFESSPSRRKKRRPSRNSLQV